MHQASYDQRSQQPCFGLGHSGAGSIHDSSQQRAFFVARRNTFGLRVLLQVEMQPCLFGADNARRPDHAMVCNGMQPNETEGNVMQQSLGSRLPLYKTRLMLSISKCKVDLNITYGLK